MGRVGERENDTHADQREGSSIVQSGRALQYV